MAEWPTASVVEAVRSRVMGPPPARKPAEARAEACGVQEFFRRERLWEPFRAEAFAFAVPQFFRKDKLWLQCVGLACLMHSISSRVAVFDRLEAFAASASASSVYNRLEAFAASASVSSQLPFESLGSLPAFDLPAFDLPAFERVGVVVELHAWQVWQICALVVLILAAACWEATRAPRLAAHGTPIEAVRTVLQLLGDVLLLPCYIWAGPEAPELGFQCSDRNLQILEMCPSLSEFKQTPWLRNANVAFSALMVLDIAFGDRYRKFVRRETLTTPDGGVIALDWWEDRPDVASSKRVLLVGSTFTGDALTTATRNVCRHFSARGWRVVVFVRRGCGRVMPNAQPQGTRSRPLCLAGFSDFELAVDRVAALCNGLPICGLGLSTGGGQLRAYLNALGARSKLAAGVVVDSPTSSDALYSLDRRLPMIAKALIIAARDALALCGSGVPPASDADGEVAGAEEVLPGGFVQYVRDELAPRHGFAPTNAGVAKYLRSCEPPADSSACARPTLELVSLNDQLISPEEARRLQTFWRRSPNVVTAVTANGTHLIRWHGGLRPRCWVSEVAAEFLEAALCVGADADKGRR